jgi:alkylation response protein AidB-like acyl-CoA dehydrogenase
MDLRYSDEQLLLRDSVRGTVAREASFARVREWVLDRSSPDLEAPCELAVRQGWTGIGVDEERGGQGGGPLELSILAEELGRGAVPADALYASILGAVALAHGLDGGTLIQQLAEGHCGAALVHPGDQPVDTTPLGSAANLVVGAWEADLLLRWDGSRLDVYLGETQYRRKRRLVDRTRSVADVALQGNPIERVEGVDASALRSVAALGAVVVAADALGAAQRMLDLTVEYVGERIQFGKPVGSFQAVKHTAAEMLVAIEGTRAAIQYAAWALGADEPGSDLDAWVAKAKASRCATFIADKALFLHGAVGYTWEHDLQLLFKRAKSDADLLGSAAVYDERIADRLALIPEPSLAT